MPLVFPPTVDHLRERFERMYGYRGQRLIEQLGNGHFRYSSGYMPCHSCKHWVDTKTDDQTQSEMKLFEILYTEMINNETKCENSKKNSFNSEIYSFESMVLTNFHERCLQYGTNKSQ